MSGTFTRRGNRWLAQIMLDGQRKTKTFDTKRQGQAWVAELISTDVGAPRLNWTLAELSERYQREVSVKKKGVDKEVIRLQMYGREFPALFARKLASVQREDIEALVDQRLLEIKPSTMNRDLNIFSNLFKHARRWRMMNHNPMTDMQRPKDPPGRERRVSADETAMILAALSYSEEFPIRLQRERVAIAFLLAIETAMRQGEICKTEWINVHLDERYIFLPHTITKTGVARNVPLSVEAGRLIERLPRSGSLMLGVTSGVVSTMARKAIARAGIEDMVFHDTRHEATTRLAQKLQVLDLARVTGHRDIKQLMTYYNKDARELAELL